MMIVGIITLLIALVNGRATKREEQKEGPAVDEPIDTGNRIYFYNFEKRTLIYKESWKHSKVLNLIYRKQTTE